LRVIVNGAIVSTRCCLGMAPTGDSMKVGEWDFGSTEYHFCT
jgi:hypothetical protein